MNHLGRKDSFNSLITERRNKFTKKQSKNMNRQGILIRIWIDKEFLYDCEETRNSYKNMNRQGILIRIWIGKEFL